ncbi:uncharacterized protein LOC143909627 [Arctopsyche grandis]|uniref:uncharacterized protein LOC143909627 n=1 Tax=Arctopsyche grandis TaxID=121162 RepID=UPI00406D81DB
MSCSRPCGERTEFGSMCGVLNALRPDGECSYTRYGLRQHRSPQDIPLRYSRASVAPFRWVFTHWVAGRMIDQRIAVSARVRSNQMFSTIGFDPGLIFNILLVRLGCL